MSTRASIVLKLKDEDIGKKMKFEPSRLPLGITCDMAGVDKVEWVELSKRYIMIYHNYDSYYLVKPSYAMDAVDTYVVIVHGYGRKNVGMEDIGNTLAGDYNPKDRVSREAALNLQVKKLQSLKQGGNKVMITSGNQYAVPYADFVTDMNLDARAVNIIDEQVPFYTMALHGLVNYSGGAINLADDEKENILKSAESGAGLYFTYIAE